MQICWMVRESVDGIGQSDIQYEKRLAARNFRKALGILGKDPKEIQSTA